MERLYMWKGGREMLPLYITIAVIASMLILGVYIGIVAAIAITVAKFLLKKR